MFTDQKSYINSRQIDVITFPHVVDSVMSYANSKKTFMDSYGSVSHMGESFQTRLINTCTNGGVVEVCFRPALALLACKTLLPGPQFKLEFTFSNNQASLFESLVGNVATSTAAVPGAQEYQVKILDFSFFKANSLPSPMVPLPQSAVLDLNVANVFQYFLNQNANNLRQNVTLPPTTNTVYVCLQDYNSANLTTPPITGAPAQLGIGTGYNPQTSFAYAVSNASNDISNAYATVLQTLYIHYPELGVQIPNPTYSFTGATGNDWQRAYMDFINVTQGTSALNEGCVPLGSYSTTAGASITYLDPTTPANSILQAGNPSNPEQAIISTKALLSPFGVTPFAPTLTTFNQSSRWGWLGKNPGPIFAFPCIRPENRAVSSAQLNATFTGTVVNCAFNVVCVYSLALSLTALGNGQYEYHLLEGV